MLVHRASADAERPAQVQQTATDYRHRLRAHSKRAWNMFNDMIAAGELDRYYGPLLAAHVYLTRGRPSHTVSQREVARHANLPLDRVKDQMRRLESLGILFHQREGNRWRTTLLPFVTYADAVRNLACARAWTHDQAAAYVVDLADRGVRLPWITRAPGVRPGDGASTSEPDPSFSRTDEGVCQVEPHEDRVSALLQAAQRAVGKGELHQAVTCITTAAQELLTATTAMQEASSELLDAETTADTAAGIVRPQPQPGAPRNDPANAAAFHPAMPPADNPRTPRKSASQRAKRALLMGDRNPNHHSESPNPPRQMPSARAARTEERNHYNGTNGREPCLVDNEAVQYLVAEGIYPGNVRRFADLPGEIIQAAAISTGLPPGHVHRAGRLVERLEAYRAGMWQPPSVLETTATTMRQQPLVGTLSSAESPSPTLHDGTGSAVVDGKRNSIPDDHDTLWSAVLGDLSNEVSAAEFETWLCVTQLVDLDTDTAIVAAGNIFAKDHLAATCTDLVERQLQRQCGRSLRVAFVIA